MPERFPQEAALRDGRRVLIRPFTSRDTAALYAFFQRLPKKVRKLAWDNIDDRALVESWGRYVDYDKTLPLLAVDGEKVVADATLHYRDSGPLRLVGRLKWLLDPEYRGDGLGSVLVNRFIEIARRRGLRHLTCMLVTDLEEDAVRTLRALGFTEHAFPGYGVDPDGGSHDMIKLVMAL